MEDYRGLYHGCILNVRKSLLDVAYYRNHRCDWERDRSAEKLLHAEENLKQAERMLEYIMHEKEQSWNTE